VVLGAGANEDKELGLVNGLLSPRALARVQADYVKTFCTQTATIRRTEEGQPDGYGGRDKRYKVVGTVACALQGLTRPQRVEEGMQNKPLADWEVLLPVGTEVLFGDLIDIDSNSYEVVGSDQDSAINLVVTAYVTRKTR
jgi:hypothetical protein